jgi:NAD-dependent dihydropyrimidine dehydrogenase PreA subunit
LERYDRWVRERRIPFSSKVIPVQESLEGQQWVLPTEQVVELLRNARTFAATDCECRTLYRRCDNPISVCFLINDVADSYVAQKRAERVTLDEARHRLRLANERGLVHLTIYNPDQYVYAICSCCPCCCHDLQFLFVHGRTDLVARSEYVARTNPDLCSDCGCCVERCVFAVRALIDGRLTVSEDGCYGCGLCVTACPEDAIRLVRR